MPTALIFLPIAIGFTALYCFFIEKFVFAYYRRKKSDPIIFLIASIGVMFFSNGLIRLIIGPDDRNINDGERFILKAKTIKKMLHLIL